VLNAASVQSVGFGGRNPATLLPLQGGPTMTATPEIRATILLVENDSALSMLLIDRLGAEGYILHKAASAAQAVELAVQISPDLILLDLSLPDQHGLVLCAELKEKQQAPIIICSATKQEHEAILALKLGADDFVAKPFSVDELAARIEAVLRRAGTHTVPESDGLEDIERVGELVIDRAGYVATVGDELLKLTPTEYRLLCTLANRPDQVLCRQELAEALWGYYDVGVSRSLDVHIRRLRSKLKACAVEAPDIVTVRGFGFKMARKPEPSTGIVPNRGNS
jgi:DNA-binding response OmpR family regulator